ncbi:MAG TPA: alpha/beta hydrolase [Chitinophagales bacterium]
MSLEIKEESGFRYVEVGSGPVILNLHGLFGALSNFKDVTDFFSKRGYTVTIPILPLYTWELDKTNVLGMVEYIENFVKFKGYKDVNLIGNSLGGHVALIYTLQNEANVKSMTLTASSGIFENSLGDQYPRKNDKEYIRRKTAETFYDPKFATDELVDELFDIISDREKVLRVIYMAKSAVRHNLREELHQITIPCNLIWGKQDTITPPFVGEDFHKLLTNSELTLLVKCGHAPLMEVPNEFNACMEKFLNKVYGK